jgi:hypothetical protein
LSNFATISVIVGDFRTAPASLVNLFPSNQEYQLAAAHDLLSTVTPDEGPDLTIGEVTIFTSPDAPAPARPVLNPSSIDSPVGAFFPWGFFEMPIAPYMTGSARVQLQFMTPQVISDYWLYGPTPDVVDSDGSHPAHWYDFAFDPLSGTGAQFAITPAIDSVQPIVDSQGRALYYETIDLSFVDGQRGDADLTANDGIIEAQGGPAFTLPESPIPTVTTMDPNQIARWGVVVSVTATVTAGSGSPPVGSVQFQVDGTDYGAPVGLQFGAAALTVVTLAPGDHHIVAFFTSADPLYGNSNNSLLPFDLFVTLDAPHAVLTIDGAGAARYMAAAGIASRLTVSLTNGTYSWTDPSELIIVDGAGAGGWSGSGTNAVSGPQDGLSSIDISTGNQSNVIRLLSSGVPVTVEGLGASDTYDITLGNFGGPVTIADDATNGNENALNVIAVAGTNTITKTHGQITWGNPAVETITYSGIQELTIDGSAGSSNTVIDPGDPNTTIVGGPDVNHVSIANAGAAGVDFQDGGGKNDVTVTLGSLLGPVNIKGTAGINRVTAELPAGDNVFTLTGQQLTGAGQTVHFDLAAALASLTLDGSAGHSFLIVQGNPPGPLTLNGVTMCTPPAVITAPASERLNAGATATFTAAGGGTPLDVQWQVSSAGGPFTDIPGATSGTYTFTTSATDDGKRFRAVFSNPLGTVTTNDTTLTVHALAPVVATQPVGQGVADGQTVTFTAAARGFPMPTVQWLVRTRGGTQFQPVANNSSTDPSSLTFVAQAADNGNQYEAVFTNSAGTVTTKAATLTVSGSAPTVDPNGSPVSQTVAAGATVRFTASGSGSPTPRVQWQVSTDGGSRYTDIAGATATALTFRVQAAQDLFEYRAAFINSHGVAYTSPATLTVPSVVLAAPVVIQQPSPTAPLPAGRYVTFTAQATGANGVQWESSSDGGHFRDIAGATATSYRVLTQPDQNGMQFRAVFSNPVGNTRTNAVALAVYPVPTTLPTAQTVYDRQTVTFRAAAASSPGLTVQWQRRDPGSTSFVPIANATAQTLTFVAQVADNRSDYRAVFTSTVGSVSTQSITAAARLTVNALPLHPVIITQPVHQTAAAGQTVTFTAAALARAALTVQWWVITRAGKIGPVTNNPTATTATLTITASALDDGSQYYAVFTAGSASVMTNRATLAVAVPPTITMQPKDLTVTGSKAVYFMAGASGARVTVQWQVSSDGGLTFQDIAGARGTLLTLQARAADNGNLFRAIFTNAVGQVITSAAVLRMY